MSEREEEERGGEHVPGSILSGWSIMREVGEGTEAFVVAFIGVVREDWSVMHLFFHKGEAADLSDDGGDCF